MEYLKLKNDGDTVEFTPVEFDREQFSLWDIQNNEFIQEGEQVQTENGVQEVNKFITLTDEEKKKQYNRNLQFIWEVRESPNGEINYLPLKKTAHEALEEQMNTVEAAGNDPFDFVYTVKRDGKGLNTQYKVKTNGRIEDVWGESQENPESVDLSLDDDNSKEEVELTSAEEQYVQALNTDPKAQEYRDEKKVKVLVNNAGLSEERAEYIVENFAD